MMGAADEIPQAPKDKITFVEDMSENELASALDLPCGLTNLGNTCYLNATVQCLKTVPELKEVLSKFTGHLTLSEHEGPQNITVALRDMLESMESQSTVVPVIMVQVLHMIFPRFAEKSEHGGFMQQDANECWTELLRMLQQKLQPIDKKSNNEVASGAAKPVVRSFVDQFFGGRYKVTMKNTECEEEPVSHSTEDFLQLSCFISQETRYMQAGIKSSLEEKITKHSPKLGTDATYLKTCKIDRLPAYLAIQFVRFRYKEKASTNAKILKDIKFSINLDVYELCTEELQQKLMPMRALFKEEEDRRALEASSDKGLNKSDLGEANKKDENVSKYKHPFSFADDLGSNNSGYYTLQAVLTHLGRSSSSGHYVAWVKGKNNEWFKCDDDTVSLVSEEEILKLSGGGKDTQIPRALAFLFSSSFWCLSSFLLICLSLQTSVFCHGILSGLGTLYICVSLYYFLQLLCVLVYM